MRYKQIYISKKVSLAKFFDNQIVLESDRALLRPLVASDIDDLEKISYTDGLWEYGRRVKNKKDLEEYIGFCLDARKSKTLYPFAVIDKLDKQIAGITMLGGIDLANKRLEIGWTWLGTAYQGTGLNRACKAILLKYAFEELGMRRVEFKVDNKNIKSQKAVEKLGAFKEGCLRNYAIQSYGNSSGTMVYSIIDDEWKTLKNNM